jgi:hypothetical protein
MSECAFVKEVYLTVTPLCLRSALDPKVASAVRANFSREKFKGQYEAERSDHHIRFNLQVSEKNI